MAASTSNTGTISATALHHYPGLNSHGITRIERLTTDNAWAYRWALRGVCAEHDIQKFIKPHCPWQNGKVEHLNRTLATEWAYRQVFTSNDERASSPCAVGRALQH